MSIYCHYKQKSVFLNSVSPTSTSVFHYLQKPKESCRGPAQGNVRATYSLSSLSSCTVVVEWLYSP